MKALVASLLIGLFSCASPPERVRVGFKSFDEQRVLAHLLKVVIESGGTPVDLVECADTYACHLALRSGQVDIVVEYRGTVRHPDREAADIKWMEPLGFTNSYRIVVSAERATLREVETISDLANLKDGEISVSCPAEYLERPGDGLEALLRRHGLKLSESPVVENSVTRRVELVLTGRSDAAIFYETDASLTSGRLRALRDSLQFFPAYDAAIVGRASVLERLRDELAPLSGVLRQEVVEKQVHAVQVNGFKPAASARRIVSQLGLVPELEETGGKPPVVVAVPSSNAMPGVVERALRAVRETFPERPVRVSRVGRPSRAVAEGEARIGVVATSAFYDRSMRLREHRVDAVAVVGATFVHLLRRPGDEGAGLGGRVGLAESALPLARIFGLQGGQTGTLKNLAALLRDGELDAVVALEPAGSAVVREALEGLAVADWPKELSGKAPYLRPARLPARTYDGQDSTVELLAMQLVLIAPSSRKQVAVTGPAAALPEAALPLSAEQARTLAHSTGMWETPSVALPTPWRMGEPDGESDERSRLLEAVLNILALLFLGLVVFLLSRGKLGESLSGKDL
jgi:glycine betaine/choline ABC-type transport system substrate-binding protein